MAIPKLRSHFKPHKRVTEDGTILNRATGEYERPPSMTKQEFLKETDINNILKQYSVTGMLNHVSANAAQGRYEDLPDPTDFQESLHQVKEAETAFMSLPSKLRARFDNEPVNFLAFLEDPSNEQEARALGLLKALPEPPAPVKVEVIDKEAKEPPQKA